MLGFGEGERLLLPDNLTDLFSVRFAYMSDSLSRKHLQDMDIVLVNLDRRSGLAARMASIQASSSAPLPLITFGASRPGIEVFQDLKPIGHIVPPLDASYLQGLCDASVFDRRQILTLDSQRESVRRLWELSSALLRVTRREQLPQALGTIMPELMKASLVSICMPETESPLIYFWTRPALGQEAIDLLEAHLEESWAGVRPDVRASFEWVEKLEIAETRSPSPTISKNSFISAPISLQGRPVGFLTVLPLEQPRPSEDWLKTFFVVSDLVNVLLHNLDLRDQLSYRATHDGLTGLLNRQSILETLEKECRRARRYHGSVTVVMVDLDHFKQINDTMGHLMGDEVLRQSTARLLESLREFDIAGRTGGEEFLVLLPHVDGEGGMTWARRFQSLLSNTPIATKQQQVEVTASCGVASCTDEDCHVDRLVAMADSALYSAKNAGRNRVTLADARHVPEIVTPSQANHVPESDFDEDTV